MAWGSRLMRRSELSVPGNTSLTTVAVAVAVMAALYLGRAIAIPIAIAILISFSLGPPVTWLRRHYFGRIFSVIVVVIPALVLVGAFAYLVTTQVGRLAENIPAYQTNMEQKLSVVQRALPARDMLERGSDFLRSLRSRAETPESRARMALRDKRPGAQPEIKPIPVEIQEPNPTSIDLLKSVMGPLVQPLVDCGLVLLFVVFFLVERETLRDRFLRLAGASDLHRTTMAMDEAGYRVSRYLLLQLIVNLIFGLAVGLGLLAIGVPNAPLWGGMAAVMRFIPYLGVPGAAILPLALAFAVDPGWSMLIWTATMFIGLELVVANVIEPLIYGASTGLSPVALVVSAIFWTWLWGSIGLLLSTPLTVCIVVLGRYVPKLSFLEVLFGNSAPLQLEESFYQRLLAGDPDEATEQAEDFLKTGSLVDFYDTVALPALALAERDRAREVLDEEHRQGIVQGLELVFENLDETPKKGDDKKNAEAAHAVKAIVLCVAGRGDLDEAAASMLAHLLKKEGYDARTVSLESALRPFVDPGEHPDTTVVCLSYMNADSVPHARYLGRRFKRTFGEDIGVLTGFWGADEAIMHDPDMREATGADAVVTTLHSALDVIAARWATPTDGVGAAPTLTDLAARASAVVAETI